jgi:hypothetical protein
MKQNVLNIVNRIIKKKAVGIIYNVPKNDRALLQNKLLDEKKHLVVQGRDVYTSAMLKMRLGHQLKVKHLSYNMLPTLLDGKMITITDADMIKESYNKIFDDFFKYKIPLLLLVNKDAAMDDIRKLSAYTRVLTMEFDYSSIN